ncbi:MAG: radical SAM protein [Desulfomonile tiedjei]|uniref:Radical SAM protein n=1 Tax=Desulfomonile tiedjei TaxID=2358 RepID=A0A9D6Z2T6_9BACT|nr:radical SAM protein [Desulfomonile tiedjei]
MKRPQILLVNPWIHDFAAYDLWARPMGLLVLASRLRKLGWEPRLLDCVDPDHPEMPRIKVRSHAHGRFHRSPIPRPECLQGIRRTYCRYGIAPEILTKDLESIPRPALILVTSLMTYWYPGVRETVQLLREAYPRVPILLGGIYASLLPDHARISAGADDVLPGPGEAGLSELLFHWTGIASAADEQANTLEFSPALDLMRKVRFLPLITSRGCPFKCAYCASRILAPSFVTRDPEEVIQEIERACVQYGIKDVALYDDAFLVHSQEQAIPILDNIAERLPGIRIHAPNGLHASAIDRATALAMKRGGFETIRIGLESLSDEFHARTGGKTAFRGFFSAVEHLKDAGFSRKQIGTYLLVGLPGQSREMIEADVEAVLAAGAHPKLAEFSPIPGTAMWRESLARSRYPIDKEPLFQNCTLLSAADPEVDEQFLSEIRKRISLQIGTDGN